MPNIGLAPLTLIAPVFVAEATTLSVDSSILPLVINADLNTIVISVLVGPTVITLINPTVVNGVNQFTGSIAINVMATSQLFQLTGYNFTASISADPELSTPTIQYQLLYLNTQLAVQISPPSGVTIYKGPTSCVVQWATPTFTGFVGVRVQWSTDPSGVTVPYTQYGNLLASVSSTMNIPLGAPTVSTVSTPITNQSIAQTLIAVTSTTTNQAVDFSSVTIPASLLGVAANSNATIFYVILTTVIQDPNTNAVYESLAAGPFTCGFVNLQVVNPTDFLALQTSSAIATRMITELTRREPQLDLTARSEIRDIIINPMALELANMSVREWFCRCCQSISAISTIDNASGNGVSDPVATSTVKQQIARAYGLGTTDVQTFIDQRFDILGEGIPRGGSTTSVVTLTFFVFAKPTNLINIQAGCICTTIPDATSAAVQFVTTASASIDPSNSAAYYNPANGWWSVNVPAQCTVSGSIGEVGAGTILQVTSGGPSGISVTNQVNSEGGTDQQSNSAYAAMIMNRLVTGVDTSSRNGYTDATLEIPGITQVQIQAAGDTFMLRDWSSLLQKHTYGCVDIYTRGSAISQQSELVPFTYLATSTYGAYSTYLTAVLISTTNLIGVDNLLFKIANFQALAYPLYTVIEMVITSTAGKIWLGVQNAQFDNVHGYLVIDPSENAYQILADGSTAIWQINGINATNLQVVTSVGTQASVVYYFMAAYQSGFVHQPALQPVFTVDSLVGPVSGAIASTDIELVYTNDFLLTGGSNEAGDTVTVSGSNTFVTTAVITTTTQPVTIDTGISIGIDGNGNPLNVLSVRSIDMSTLYTFGTDYSIVSAGPYHTYAFNLLSGTTIPLGNQVIVAYNKFLINETLTYQSDSITLTGTTPTALLNDGFVENSWLPVAHGNTTLMLDGFIGEGDPETGLIATGIAPASRYIKVSFINNADQTIVASLGQDFILTVNAASGAATVTRAVGSVIPSGTAVQVNYFTTEVFTLVTDYPPYVQQAITTIDNMKAAGADILVKAMVESNVDITMVVNLLPNVMPQTVDPLIRTAIGIALNNANNEMAQSVLIGQVQAVPGVESIQLPLVKCAKSDGSYDIGYVITTGTTWNVLSTDAAFVTVVCPPNSFITAEPVLPDPTIPSGGEPNQYVGLLYEGQPFTRCMTIQDFLASSAPSFYFIGADDQIAPALQLNSSYEGRVLICIPSTLANPGIQAYFATFVVYGAATASDIVVSTSEYLSVGNLNLLYSSSS